MKLSWINVLATMLILGGVLLLVQRRMSHARPQIPTAASPDAAKADAIKRIEAQLGRPLNDAEHAMIEATRDGDHINVVVHQPLSGRLAQAQAAALKGSGQVPTTESSSGTPTGVPIVPPAPLPEIGPAPATSNPTTGPG